MSEGLRIAVGGIHTECSTSSPVEIVLGDFRILSDEDLPKAEAFSFLREAQDVVLRPLIHARAVPGGPVRRATYETLKADFLGRLSAALPLDGLYLPMHGAVKVSGLDDAEGDWISAARDLVGSACVVAASYDLHGNVSQRVVDQLDIFAAYRTAPHIDTRETMVRAWTMLLDALRTGKRPGIAWATVPLLLPGECTSTEDEPARSLYAALPAFRERPGILDANLMIGYVWADEPRAMAAAVVTGLDADAAKAAAGEIASGYWQARELFSFGPPTGPLEAMLDIAEASETRPVILADSGDNPTGGGVGDRADVLAALISRNFHGALIAGITDREGVEAAFAAGEGAYLFLRIGGSLDPSSRTVEARARVLRLDDPGSSSDRQALVSIGGIELLLAAKRRPYHAMADFERLGIAPHDLRLLVVKSGYLSPELAPISRPNLIALTDGVVSQDIPRLENHRRIRPLFPFQRDFGFTPEARLSERWSV